MDLFNISTSEASCAGSVSHLLKQLFVTLVHHLVLQPFIQPSHQPVWAELGTQGNQEGNHGWRNHIQSCSYGTGLDALGFEWHWQGWLQARHCDGLRDTFLRGQGLSAPEEISLMRHISCPQQWPLSPECHVSVTGSCWIWSSAVPGSWEHLPGGRISLISILVL